MCYASPSIDYPFPASSIKKQADKGIITFFENPYIGGKFARKTSKELIVYPYYLVC
ncbi:hypothetical protein Mucpa_3447 [Mucilaginibacter paludis DSM 18603]|uniref:Uncharacterized protein n=1 Tax=Mucilaginibacter paludis DSM 18603 TaxID=714943 RepID=H1YID3_9SPHI|nr:hypothetical protein Mucpa_3447 [Mucilaginibacter paludis DSM 18603]